MTKYNQRIFGNLWSHRVSIDDLLMFYVQFASLINSNLPLRQVLENLSRHFVNWRLRSITRRLLIDLDSGIDLGDAMSKFPTVFDSTAVSVVRSGLATGLLGQALDHLVIFVKTTKEIKELTQKALFYPITIMLAGFLGIFVFLIVGVPLMTKAFHGLKIEVSREVQEIIELSEKLRQFDVSALASLWVVMPMLILLLLLGSRIPQFRRLLHRSYLITTVGRFMALERFSRLLHIQLSNQINLVQALFLAGHGSGNSYISQNIAQVIRHVAAGHSLHQAMSRQPEIYRGVLVQMVAVGEESGDMATPLKAAADFFNRVVFHRLSFIAAVTNVVAIVSVGSLVVSLMWRFFEPIISSTWNVAY